MKILVAVLLVLLDGMIPLVAGARILAMLPLYARSHHRFHQGVLKALAGAGHEVVVYSPFPLDHSVANYTDILLDDITIDSDFLKRLVVKYTESPPYRCQELSIDVFSTLSKDFMRSNIVKGLIKGNEHFDLIVTEISTGQEFTVILGEIFKVPVINLQAFVTNDALNNIFGNPLSISYIPNLYAPFSNNMTFLERIENMLYSLRQLYFVNYFTYFPLAEAWIRDNFPNPPPVMLMKKNISLTLVNDHLTAGYSQPRTANIIPVAGIHIEDEKPLPKNLKDFIDEAAEGVILFSLGTYVPDELQPKEYFDMYIRVFSQLKQRVLWKTRKEDIEGLPDNVMTLKWAPQRDILRHPKTVLFITHGGLLSQHETIHCGVPVVVIPQFCDQHRNARFYEEKGIGVKLSIQDLTETTILASIRSVLDDPQYTTNVKTLSRLFKDRPLSPAETVVYWTEHVLRHGASHLRPASTQLAWYQLALLDVLAVLLAVVTTGGLIMFFACRRLLNYMLKRNSLIQINAKKNK